MSDERVREKVEKSWWQSTDGGIFGGIWKIDIFKYPMK
jgi:hypothetical protein